MKELRDIKIDMLTGSQNPVLDLFNQITDGVVIINCEVYNNEGLEFIYHKDGEWIFYQDIKNEKFWCNYDRYWEFFESEMGLVYFDIQTITKYLVEEALKREVAPPKPDWITLPSQVEEALKREVAPPYKYPTSRYNAVEEALRREVAPPQGSQFFDVSGVDEALKRNLTKAFTKSCRLFKKTFSALVRQK